MDGTDSDRRNGPNGHCDSSVVCHVCVFYPQTEIGAQVLPHVERIIRMHRPGLGFRFDIWPFDALQNSPYSAKVRACADIADVAVIATDGEGDVPDMLRNWLEGWQGQPRGGKVRRLMALVDARSPDRLPMSKAFRSLADFAISSGIGFVWCGVPEEQSNDGAAPPPKAVSIEA